MRRRKRRNQRKIIIISSLTLLFIMTVGYAAFQTNINITVKGNILEKSRVIQSWTINANTDFHNEIYRENIVSVTFLDNNKIPDNAVESWDVSESKDGGVMAYIIANTTDTTKYDLYIGANKGVIANEKSSYLFNDFDSLSQLSFNDNFDTSNVKMMSLMFAGNSNFETLDLSSFDTSKVTHMTGMFSRWRWNAESWGTSKLKTIIFGDKFLTNNVVYMGDMFSGTPITTLDLSNFNTSKVITMRHMFINCASLEKLNLCSFDTSNGTNMEEMMAKTPNLKNVYVGSNWVIENANTTNMFYNSGVSSVTTGQCK